MRVGTSIMKSSGKGNSERQRSIKSPCQQVIRMAQGLLDNIAQCHGSSKEMWILREGLTAPETRVGS